MRRLVIALAVVALLALCGPAFAISCGGLDTIVGRSMVHYDEIVSQQTTAGTFYMYGQAEVAFGDTIVGRSLSFLSTIVTQELANLNLFQVVSQTDLKPDDLYGQADVVPMESIVGRSLGGLDQVVGQATVTPLQHIYGQEFSCDDP
jgi:hypothetical protein